MKQDHTSRRHAAPLMAFLLAAVPTLLPAGGAPQGQTAGVPAPAIRVTVRMVLADAIVTDKDGKPFTGLSAQDFTLLEDGKPQKLTMVSFERPAEIARALQSRRMQLPPNVTTNRPEFNAPAGPPVVILLDALNTSLQDQARARLELLKYLDSQLKPGQPVAVYTLAKSLRLLQDFTDDPTLLKAAVQAFTPNTPVEQQLSRINELLPRLSGARPDDSVRGPHRDASIYIRRMADFYNDQANLGVDMRAGITLSAFRAIAQSVSGLPGRKSVIWVSGSFPITTYTRIIKYSADADNDPNRVAIDQSYEENVRQAASILTDAQIAVYPVDARGLTNLAGGADSQGVSIAGTLKSGVEYAQDLKQASYTLQDSQATMKQMAEDTGGKVFVNQNDLDNSVATSIEDGAAYYLLAYTPDTKLDGKLHKIEVKVDRPGAMVRSRRGYYAVAPSGDSKAVKQREAEVAAAMMGNSPGASGVTFDARVVPPAPAGKMKVGIDFIVDPTTISAEDAGGGSKSLAIEFHAAAYGADGKLEDHRDTSIKATLKPDDYKRIQQGGVPFHLELELGPGSHTLRLGVVDQHSGVMGTADMPLELAKK